ncbi:hypothetical protein GH714_033545 [Hevea brasiliensis]|uniref:Late embryogenesis abundant protein LEA-2 subgroup domain-containing protein n=1 Tax=Hevea brasiliensis TaxID=3981 RepID=A0A6A6MRH9_HEVBR|nr:hypothetical protein GH714_033545 [Hevea brasiliensis]
MADQQKIHPVTQDVEAAQPPTAPLMPRNSSKSDKGDPAEHFPPLKRTIPVMHSKPPKKKLLLQFNLSGDSSLSAAFDVTITATNPNKKIGIYYEGGSHISVWYTGTKLCEGSLPKFYQGHKNTTVLIVPLTGQTQDANGLLTSLQQQQQENGIIPLNLRVKQPVRIKLGKLKLMKVKFSVKCRLDVDSLSANNAISIRNSSCKFRLRL